MMSPRIPANQANAFTVMVRRAYGRERARRFIATVLRNVKDGVATTRTISKVIRATGLDPRKKKDRERLERMIAPAPTPGLTGAAFSPNTLECIASAITAEGHRGIMIALYPPPELAEQLAIKGGEPPANMHVTVAYLGKLDDLPADAIERAVNAVRKAVGQHGPLDGEFGGVGRFSIPDGDAFHACVDVPGLTELRAAICEALQEAGIPAKQNHGYSPHMTLKYLDSDERSPIERLEPQKVHFDTVWVVSGDTERVAVKLTGE